MRPIATHLIGLLLLTAGLLGPFTYADDFRHFGEISVAIALALSGICLLATVLGQRWQSFNALPVAAPFILVGLLIGVLCNASLLGLSIGAVLGLVTAWWRCGREQRKVAP